MGDGKRTKIVAIFLPLFLEKSNINMPRNIKFYVFDKKEKI
jgi:hypothetical protein